MESNINYRKLIIIIVFLLIGLSLGIAIGYITGVSYSVIG